jgi:hypothetical protein
MKNKNFSLTPQKRDVISLNPLLEEDNSTTQMTEIRIELLKIVYRHDKDPLYLCNRAKEFENYINGVAEK